MGHAIQFYSCSKRSEIMDIANDFAFYNTDRGENPTGHYHGNMTIHDNIICDSYDAACNKIRELDRGFYDDHAVQYYDKSEIKPTKAEIALQERRNAQLMKKKEYIEEHSVTKLKSQLISCPQCSSKINVHYNGWGNSNFCPVCRKDLRAQYILDRIKKFDSDIEDLDQKLYDAEKNRKGKCPIRWCLKVEVHC